MSRRSTRLFHTCAIALFSTFALAGNVLGAKEDETTADARLEGYGKEVALEGSTATMWMLLILLTLVTLAVLMKNANRSHLD